MTYDRPLTVLSNLPLMAAIAWPMFSTRRRRPRFGRTGRATAGTVPYLGPVTLAAAGLGLLAAAGLP